MISSRLVAIMFYLVALPLLGVSFVHAQTSISLSAGWGLPVGGQDFATLTDYSSTNSYTETVAFGSLGAGIALQGGVRHMFSETFGLELEVGYAQGAFLGEEYLDDDDEEFLEYSATQIRVMPSVVIQTGGEGVQGYARFGLLLPVSVSVQSAYWRMDENYFSGGEDRIITQNRDFSMRTGIGFQGGLGVLVPVKGVMISGEVRLQGLTLKPKSSIVTEYMIGEDNELRGLSTANKETLFFDAITEDNNNRNNSGFDSDDPSEELAPSLPFGNVGFCVGVIIPIIP